MSEQNNISLFLLLINQSIRESESLQTVNSEVNWDRIYELSVKNMLVPLLYNPIQKLKKILDITPELLEKWRKSTMTTMLFESQKYVILRKILSFAKERNITCVLFKGCVLADLYPNYLERISSDTDIFVYQRDKEKAVKLFEDLGFRKSTISSKNSVYNYILDSACYKVELHFSLWEDYRCAKIDQLEGMQLTREETLVRMEACGMEITTLGYEEHLIFQVFHIIKHFSLQGIGIRYLTDITLYINRYEDKIDFIDFWNKMESLNYDKFCENLFFICQQYFGMSPGILVGRKVNVIHNIEGFIMDLMKAGPGFDKRTAEWHLVGIMKPYFLGEQNIPKSKLRRRIKIIFPERKVFPIAYARKHPILLPVAWIHRCILFLVKLPTRRKNLTDSREKMHLSEIRLSLMQSLGLTDGGNK